jgi:hypothetical protein
MTCLLDGHRVGGGHQAIGFDSRFEVSGTDFARGVDVPRVGLHLGLGDVEAEVGYCVPNSTARGRPT